MEQMAAANIMMQYPELGLRKGKFRKTITQSMERWMGGKDEENIFGFIEGYLPDLYCIDEKRRLIGIFEIEDSSKLKSEKLQAYAEFAFGCDTYDISVELYTADRYGRNVQFVNLFPALVHSLQRAEMAQ